jgi:hypothetical protein
MNDFLMNVFMLEISGPDGFGANIMCRLYGVHLISMCACILVLLRVVRVSGPKCVSSMKLIRSSTFFQSSHGKGLVEGPTKGVNYSLVDGYRFGSRFFGPALINVESLKRQIVEVTIRNEFIVPKENKNASRFVFFPVLGISWFFRLL